MCVGASGVSQKDLNTSVRVCLKVTSAGFSQFRLQNHSKSQKIFIKIFQIGILAYVQQNTLVKHTHIPKKVRSCSKSVQIAFWQQFPHDAEPRSHYF